MVRPVAMSCVLATSIALGGCSAVTDGLATASSGASTSPAFRHGGSTDTLPGGSEPQTEATRPAGGSMTPHDTGWPFSTGATRPSAGVTPSDQLSPTNGATARAEVPETPPVTSSTLPGIPQPPRTNAPLVERPLPAAVSARGRLVGGYPVRVLRPSPGSFVLTSGVSPSSGRLQVSLTATSLADPAKVLLFYSIRLARLGFSSTPASAVGGSVARAFSTRRIVRAPDGHAR